MSEPSIFSRILTGEIPARSSARPSTSSRSATSRPRRRCTCSSSPRPRDYRNVVELAAGDPDLLAELIGLANTLAAEHADGDFRLIFNTGPAAARPSSTCTRICSCGDLDEKSLNG